MHPHKAGLHAIETKHDATSNHLLFGNCQTSVKAIILCSLERYKDIETIKCRCMIYCIIPKAIDELYNGDG